MNRGYNNVKGCHDEITEKSGISKTRIEEIAQIYAKSQRTIFA